MIGRNALLWEFEGEKNYNKKLYFTVRRLFYIFVVILISNRNISKDIFLI